MSRTRDDFESEDSNEQDIEPANEMVQQCRRRGEKIPIQKSRMFGGWQSCLHSQQWICTNLPDSENTGAEREKNFWQQDFNDEFLQWRAGSIQMFKTVV